MKHFSKLLCAIIVMSICVTSIYLASYILYGANDDKTNEQKLSYNTEKVLEIKSRLANLSQNDSVESTEKIVGNLIKFGGENYILANEFIVLTGDSLNGNVISHNDFRVELDNSNSIEEDGLLYLNVEKVASLLGYDCQFSENKYVFTRKYLAKRLVVLANEQIDNFYGASDVMQIENTCILQYASELEASQADANFRQANLKSFPDEKIISQNVEIEKSSNAESQLSANNYYSWGGEFMGFGQYNSYLLSKYTKLPEVVVVVMDTGINQEHELFSGRMKEGSACFTPNDTSLTDFLGHGTHVAGTIAELTTPNVKLVSVKIFEKDDEGALLSCIALAFKYVLALKEKDSAIKVFNGSFSWKGQSSTGIVVEKDIFRLVQKGVQCCFSAGNDSCNIKNSYPACLRDVITVGSIDKTKRLSGFSNFGNGIDFVAPGSDILSAYYLSNNRYRYMSGTSMATPHVSASVAMILSMPKNYGRTEVVEFAKENCVVDLGSAGYDYKYGNGYIDLSKLIEFDYNSEYVTYKTVLGVEVDGKFAGEKGGKITLSYFNWENQQKNYEVVGVGSQTLNELRTKSNLVLNAVPDDNSVFVGWFISTNTEDLSTVPYSTEKQISLSNLNKEKVNYIYAKFVRKVLDITINIQYISDDTVDADVFGYGTKLGITYTDKSNNSVEKGFTSGIFAENQTVTYKNVAYGKQFVINISPSGGAVLNKITSDFATFKGTNREIGKTSTQLGGVYVYANMLDANIGNKETKNKVTFTIYIVV